MAKKKDPSHDVLTALQHPLRRDILRHLSAPKREPLSPREVSEELDRPLSNVSYHVRVLRNCKALTLVRTKPVRGSIQHFYSPSPDFIAQPFVAEFLEHSS
jgi:DNA-binding transcriptional ArsR family regulator